MSPLCRGLGQKDGKNMFFAIITFLVTVFIGFFVALFTGSTGLGAVAAIALVGAVVVYRLHRIYKLLVPDYQVLPPYVEDETDEEEPVPVPEEESYGVNELDDEE